MSALNKNYPYSSSLTKIDVVSDKKKKLDSINDQLHRSWFECQN